MRKLSYAEPGAKPTGFSREYVAEMQATDTLELPERGDPWNPAEHTNVNIRREVSSDGVVYYVEDEVNPVRLSRVTFAAHGRDAEGSEVRIEVGPDGGNWRSANVYVGNVCRFATKGRDAHLCAFAAFQRLTGGIALGYRGERPAK